MPDISRGGTHHMESNSKSEARRGGLETAGPGESVKGRRDFLASGCVTWRNSGRNS